jgi:hypothetical protein
MITGFCLCDGSLFHYEYVCHSSGVGRVCEGHQNGCPQARACQQQVRIHFDRIEQQLLLLVLVVVAE